MACFGLEYNTKTNNMQGDLHLLKRAILFFILKVVHIISVDYIPGGRFKKEVIIDGQSYLLLIRDEGGAPEIQVGHDLSTRV